MTVKTGLNWKNTDLIEVVAQSAFWLRQAMSYSDNRCKAKKWVDTKLLEMLWCPCKEGEKAPTYWQKDVVLDDLKSLSTPEDLWKGTCELKYDEQKCHHCHASGLLARALLGPMDWLFDRENKEHKQRSKGNPLLWVVAKLYDQLGETNSYRTLSGMKREDKNYRIFQLLYRLPEADYDWFNLWMVDFSALLRDTEDNKEVDYCLVCDDQLCREKEVEEVVPEGIQSYCVYSIMALLNEKKDIPSLRDKLASFNSSIVSGQLSQRILTNRTQSYREEALTRKSHGATDVSKWLDSDAVKQAFTKTNEIDVAVNLTKTELQRLFFKPDEQLSKPLKEALEKLIGEIDDNIFSKDTKRVKKVKVELRKLANYFIWLCTLHPNLGSYTLRYAANYRLMPSDNSNDAAKHDRLKNPCFVIASRALPSRQLLAGARVALTHVLGPIEDYYARMSATLKGEKEGIASVERRLGHEISKAYLPVYSFIEHSRSFESELARAALLYGMISAPTKKANLLSDKKRDDVVKLAWQIFLLRDIFGETFTKEVFATVKNEILSLWNDHVPAVKGTLFTNEAISRIEEDLRIRLIQIQYILLTNAMKHHYRSLYWEEDSNTTPAGTIARLAVNLSKHNEPSPIVVSASIDQVSGDRTWRAEIEVTNAYDAHKKWSWDWGQGTPQAIDNACRIFCEVAKQEQPYERDTVISASLDLRHKTVCIRCELKWIEGTTVPSTD